MKWFLLFIISSSAIAQESFSIEFHDRFIKVNAPEKAKKSFSAIIHNHSQTVLLGKFATNSENLKFIQLSPDESRPVEFLVRNGDTVRFVALSPAAQSVDLIFGKKTYEVPAQK